MTTSGRFTARAGSGHRWDNKGVSTMGLGEDVRQQLLLLTQSMPAHQLVLPLRDFAKDLLASGYSHEAVWEVFESVRAELREEGAELREDAVMDVMDFIEGWSAPHMTLDVRFFG
jgi:hypothetical protein